MISNNLFLFFVIVFMVTFEDVHLIHRNTEHILCRTCGSDVSAANYIISKSSSKSWYSFNDTLFSVNEVLVQVFSTDVLFHYPVISFTHSNCVPTGEWEESTSWFPGYQWKPCICPECGAYIGFVFEPINHGLVEPFRPFYGLILTSVIGESCKYIHLYSSQFPDKIYCKYI